MTEPFVSFASTAYGTEQYVPAMIESVLAQTDPDWELVIVDNGRVDSMAEVVQRYTHDPRIRLVRQENRGVIGGFAAATDECRGTYVVPLSSDDEVLPTFVARMREVLAQHPEALAVAADAELFSNAHPASYERGWADSIGSRPARPPGEWLTKQDVFSGRLPYYCGAYLRRVWDEVGGFSTLDDTVDENIYLLSSFLDHGRVRIIPDRLSRYRLRDDSVTRDASSVEAFERRVIDSYRILGEQAEPEVRAVARATGRRMEYMQALRRAREAFQVGDVAQARRHARTAWARHRTARSLAVVVLVHLAPGPLRAVHPLKRHVTDWMLVHSPVDWIRARISPVWARKVGRDVRASTATVPQSKAEERGLPPVSS
ncbi:glycosyltransferase family A protein [Nocardioides aurantiacus]|uniref:glycosyltransferase family A protein n=1 Tax=Nocardioides aurantiacus TaxID=86796 RepID=UPI00403F7BCA